MPPLTLVIFGITSNLAQIKLIPALYDIFEKELLPKGTQILGIARSPKSADELAAYIWKTLNTENKHHQHPIKEAVFKKLCNSFSYLDGNVDDTRLYQELASRIQGNTIFYLATYPDLYETIFKHLQDTGLNKQASGWKRLMIEKPLGHDLASSKKLNQLLGKYFTEDQIFRLDHYLGKETLQNILAFRFGNGLFSPLINKDYIDHIQVSALEDYGIGKRGGYYDKVGALKDVGQNHLLQMLSFATMDAPKEFSNIEVTKERLKILQNLIPYKDKVVFGQYQDYLQEENVSLKSQTDTFFALKTEIRNDKFKGVPIYLRAGKNLKETVTEVSIVFKVPVNRLFANLHCGEEPNVLIYRIQPNEGIVLKILTKKPGHSVAIEGNYMQFCYRDDPHNHFIPDAYEKLLLDTMMGDQTFFNDAQEVEAQWAFVDSYPYSKPVIYEKGSWGPKEADQLIEVDSRAWLEPSMIFCNI